MIADDYGLIAEQVKRIEAQEHDDTISETWVNPLYVFHLDVEAALEAILGELELVFDAEVEVDEDDHPVGYDAL